LYRLCDPKSKVEILDREGSWRCKRVELLAQDKEDKKLKTFDCWVGFYRFLEALVVFGIYYLPWEVKVRQGIVHVAILSRPKLLNALSLAERADRGLWAH
jgi:hypothetical protein